MIRTSEGIQPPSRENPASVSAAAQQSAPSDVGNLTSRYQEILASLQAASELLSTKTLPNSFPEAVKTVLTPDAQGNIHEEEFQYAIVTYLLNDLNPEASAFFRGAVDQLIGSGDTNPLSAEDAVKLALKETVGAGLLAQGEAEQINGMSFLAAQLDDNLSALYDGRGSEQDRTIAMMPIDAAIERAQAVLDAMLAGELPVLARSLEAPSNTLPTSAAPGMARVSGGGGGSGSGEFLWKPESERDGNLVVLLPSSLTGNVSSAAIYSSLPPSADTLIETGRFTGDDHNGGRAHFRFSESGGEYPDGSYVVATLKDGSTAEFQISNTSERTTA